MSFAPIKFPGSNFLRPKCDDEEEGMSLGRQVLLAFVQGAAPVVVAFTINQLFGEEPTEEDSE